MSIEKSQDEMLRLSALQGRNATDYASLCEQLDEEPEDLELYNTGLAQNQVAKKMLHFADFARTYDIRDAMGEGKRQLMAYKPEIYDDGGSDPIIQAGPLKTKRVISAEGEEARRLVDMGR